MHKTLTLSAALSLTLCACAHNTVTTPAASCAALIPDSWRQGVPLEPIPAARAPRIVPTDATPLERAQIAVADAMDVARDYAAAFVGQTGAAEKANGRTGQTIDTFTDCERRANEARAD